MDSCSLFGARNRDGWGIKRNIARSREDIERALKFSIPILLSPLSHAYFDVPYAEPSADPHQEERRLRVGLRASLALRAQKTMPLEAELFGGKHFVPTVARADAAGVFVKAFLLFQARQPRKLVVELMIWGEKGFLAVQDWRVALRAAIVVMQTEGLKVDRQ